MEKYIIRINGVEYEVEVEKRSEAPDGGIDVPVSREIMQTAAKKREPEKGQPENGNKVTAGTAGKVWKVVASEGTVVKRGDSIVVLEAMKMEIPVVAPQDGTIASIDVTVGAAVENGDTLATMN